VAGDELSAYLADVAALLPGPAALPGRAAWRAEVLAELYDGLLTAAESKVDSGVPAERAAAEAVREFGPAPVVAAGFVTEAAAGEARRVAVLLLASGPLAAAGWVAAAATSGGPVVTGRLDGAWRLMPAIGVVLAVVVPSALFAVAATGRALPRLAGHPALALSAAGAAAGACAAGDVVMVAMFGGWLWSGAAFVWPVALLAVGVSLGRCAVMARAGRRCAAIRAWLP
jgi:hypothetical protein